MHTKKLKANNNAIMSSFFINKFLLSIYLWTKKAARRSSKRLPAPSIIANAKILYSRSKDDLARYNALESQINELRQPESKSRMIQQAFDIFKDAVLQLEHVRLSRTQNDAMGTRWASCQVIDLVLDCLALVNQTFFTRSWISNLAQIQQFETKPQDLADLIEQITTSAELETIETESLVTLAPRLVVGAIAASMVYGEIRLKTNSIWPAWLMHTVGATVVGAFMLHSGMTFSNGMEWLFHPVHEGGLTIIFFIVCGIGLYRLRSR